MPYYDYDDMYEPSECDLLFEETKIIELPCKVGDKYYYISTRNIRCKRGFIYGNSRVCKECTQKECDSKVERDVITLEFEDVRDIIRMVVNGSIGKYYFLTRDEAEQRLEELE